MKSRWILYLLLIVMGTTLSCSLFSTDVVTSDQTTGETDEHPGPDPEMELVENPRWPAYLPDDIPVLAGDIRTVMGSPETNVRIFFDPLSDQHIEQYVARCKREGFECEYIVYTREGFPDNAEEKLKAGDFDAVEIIKGNIYMRLEYGEDLATLDIMISGTSSQDSSTPIPWPEDIQTSVPQPPQCQVRNIANLAYGGYQIVCAYADGDIGLGEYRQTLLALGFRETDRLINDTDEIVHILLEDESLSVKPMPHALSSTLTLQIKPVNSEP